ncbi:hypothetical protein ACFXGA_16910 [Actinosynnema sp. NPDC059335]|uniref:hypothetical protein n=1 Tax=Actinosynnema sp. NPDC059335 TaxID=3346804 RepID=UPI0036728040
MVEGDAMAAGVVADLPRRFGGPGRFGLVAGLALVVAEAAVGVLAPAVARTVFVGVAAGLWSVVAAVVAGRFAPSPRVAAVTAAGLQAGVVILVALARAVPEFLLVFVPQALVAVTAATAAARSRAGRRADPLWAGLAVGLPGGIVVVLWQLGHTGRGVLAAGLVLVAVTAVVLSRRAAHLPVVVPFGVAVALASAPVYSLVPAAFAALFPVAAG